MDDLVATEVASEATSAGGEVFRSDARAREDVDFEGTCLVENPPHGDPPPVMESADQTSSEKRADVSGDVEMMDAGPREGEPVKLLDSFPAPNFAASEVEALEPPAAIEEPEQPAMPNPTSDAPPEDKEIRDVREADPELSGMGVERDMEAADLAESGSGGKVREERRALDLSRGRREPSEGPAGAAARGETRIFR